MDRGRLTVLQPGDERPGPVVYWMSRDQRAQDNWALLHAREEAERRAAPLVTVFCLADDFLGATIRQFGFMLRGLEETARDLERLGIPFHLLRGEPQCSLPRFLGKLRAGLLVCDFDPLRVKRKWKDAVASAIDIPLVEVDAHNIVPCRLASGKREYGAYTLRPKIRRLLPDFLVAIPKPRPCSIPAPAAPPVDWPALMRSLKADRSVGEVSSFVPGPAAGRAVLRLFIRERLGRYPGCSNDPVAACVSDLSPYLHFGQVSAQRAALEVAASSAPAAAKDAFLEQLIVRRELSDNYCANCPDYDRFAGFPEWAQATLDAHRKDRRAHEYHRDRFEAADTHDALWNAAQAEMMRTGKMHNYMRMYWAKKILEWTASPEEAQETAIYLNDRYELDGRDPNGYAGIAWSIGGVHDRAWGERNVFGKIRYMSYNGCKTKFNVAEYISKQIAGK